MTNDDKDKQGPGGGGNDNSGKPEKTYTIFVNTRAKVVHDPKQTYESIVQLAFPGAPAGTKYTVTFEKDEHAAPQELVPGGKAVEIKDGKSRFTVEETGQS